MNRMLIAAAVLMAAGGCTRASVGQVRAQPPSEAAVYCAPILEPYIETQDDLVRAYADLLDAWTQCATRHKALVDWSSR